MRYIILPSRLHNVGALLNAINKDFGSLDKFINDFNAEAAAVQGSGWGWLAYYLDYKNARPEYLKNIWEVVNWKNVAERYAEAQ
ncbi:MAG: manganese superoxide dismutase [Olpidium bornovanus]|uniref:superoxide dismutase n=1 Tax=Olpidium bornovanus TaxID=278681 RepID=A0A8H8DEE8_9FUNG|nr:MAG: manganese superoxide dismutase [Olpidium bornovanus]